MASVVQGAADLGARSHAILRQGNVGCRQCFELALALNIARSDVGHWRALHRDALERESKLKRQVEKLKAKLKLRERQLFGRRSERRGKGQGNATRPGDAKPEERRKRGQQRGARGHGRRRQAELPVQPETFVELPRFRGTCYAAANWTHLGDTKDRGKLDVHHTAQLPQKAVWVRPLTTDFRRSLCG